MSPLEPDQGSRAEALILRSERSGEKHVIELQGELDMATAPALARELERVEKTDVRSIVVDLSKLAFADSQGLRALLAAEARSRQDSDRLHLVRGPAHVQRVFELTGTVDVLPFLD